MKVTYFENDHNYTPSRQNVRCGGAAEPRKTFEHLDRPRHRRWRDPATGVATVAGWRLLYGEQAAKRDERHFQTRRPERYPKRCSISAWSNEADHGSRPT